MLNVFRWYCHPDYREDLEGDLLERYEQCMNEHSTAKAKRLLLFDIVRLFRPALMRPVIQHQNLNSIPMLRNHFIIALRAISKQKGYTAINMLGLAVALSAFIVITLYIHDELSYDRFHTNADRIFRIAHHQEGEGFSRELIAAPGALRDAMVSEIPEVEQATGLYLSYWGNTLLTNENFTYYDKNLLYVDDSFFDVLSFPFIEGDARSALTNPESVVLTQNLAERFFGDSEATGKTLKFNNNQTLIVTGVIDDVPAQSHLQFDFLTSIGTANRSAWEENWGQGQMHIYIKSTLDANMESVNTKIQGLIERHHHDYMLSRNIKEKYFVQALAGVDGIHLSIPGNMLYVRVLLLVAIFLLLIAGINYVNLATARSAIRTKEIGMRKVVGATRISLINQFLVESVLTILVAGCFALALCAVALPPFNFIVQKQLSLFAVENLPVWGVILAVLLMFGIGAGLYPAFYLSAFKPVQIFRRQVAGKIASVDLRKVLVVTQFALSAMFIIGVVVINRQMRYVQSTDLGFDKDQVIVIRNFDRMPNRDRSYAVRDELESLSGVRQAGGSLENILGLRGGATGSIQLNAHSTPVPSMASIVSEDFMEVFGLEFIEGRNFTRGPDVDFSKVILNETAVKQLGIHRPAVGQKIGVNGDQTIIGVVKDFHASPLNIEIVPYAFMYTPDALFGIVKLSGGTVQETLSHIETTWKKYAPGVPFDFYFLDDAIDDQYRAEQNFNALFSVMTGLSLIIACLGLVGLAAFMAARRTKEISIRKVMGASTSSVTVLLMREFVTLILIANAIAAPVGWLLMNSWLEHFAYRIDIGLVTFPLVAMLVLLLAVLTVSWQTRRVAGLNPVESLKCE